MRTIALTLVVLVTGVAGATALASPPVSASQSRGGVAAKAPSHQLAVAGNGVDMYPAFSSTVTRYAVLTTTATAGSVDVTATTNEATGRVWVNGRLAGGDTTTVTGLVEGDEIAVQIQDSGGLSRYWLVYLPAGFPRLNVVTKNAGIAPGMVAMTLSQWNQPTPNFEIAVDVNGVPAYVHSTMQGTIDLKRQPNGTYSASRTTTTPGRTGQALVELDAEFQEVARYETVGLVDTDGHDSILRPDGSRILLAYEANSVTGLVDSVIQEIDADGDVVFEWNSGDAGLVDESVYPSGTADYAHINSVVVMEDGDLLASFRHLSAVLKIARTAHDGYAAGDIVWRLGGENSDFTFEDDPYPGGPCAQHTASELPNGHIVIYDNGSGVLSTNMCIDPANPTVPIARNLTRVTEYALDEDEGTATLVWDYTPPGRFGIFAGSAARLGNGNTLVGWAAVPPALATEVRPDGETVWEIRVPSPAGAPLYSTYRAAKINVPDVTGPEVTVLRPAAGAEFEFGQRVLVDVQCTDRGGSGLRTCSGPGGVRSGERLDTSMPGRHFFNVVATDRGGNETVLRRTYVVGPMPYRPDASIRHGGRWIGDDVYGVAGKQGVRLRTSNSVTALVRLQNDGTKADRLQVRGTVGSKRLGVRYIVGGIDVTKRVMAGTYRTAALAPGSKVGLRIRVSRLVAADPGDSRRFVVSARSVRGGGFLDRVTARVRVTR